MSGATEDLDIRDITDRWPVTSSAVLGDGTLVRLRRDTVRMPDDDDDVARDILEHPGAVAVLALDEAGRVLLIRQYRHPAGRLLWEIPAGLRDVAGEPLPAAARRELREETGYTAREWHVLADCYSSPGISTERLRIFLARRLAPATGPAYQPTHEEAHLLLAWVPLAEAVRLVLGGALHNGVAAIGILAAYAAKCDGFVGLREITAAED